MYLLDSFPPAPMAKLLGQLSFALYKGHMLANQ